MKYIRTKDEIIDLTTLSNLDISDRGDITWYYDTEPHGYMIEHEYIIKTADTIKELCDCIVRNQRIYQSLEDVFSSTATKIENIYGAIWTDNGLIYVAKLNDKGEFELL